MNVQSEVEMLITKPNFIEVFLFVRLFFKAARLFVTKWAKYKTTLLSKNIINSKLSCSQSEHKHSTLF